MSNNYFQFKQFLVEQALCAMKVTTDACIQGAWTHVQQSDRKVLDIGTGSGLLALMLAQKSNDIAIDAIEFDTNAAGQARQNAARSPWSERITVFETDIRQLPEGNQYDLVITNPPFFNNSLLGNNAAKNTAKHTLTLTYQDLLHVLDRHLPLHGACSILLPEAETAVFTHLANQSRWFTNKTLSIRHKKHLPVKRIVSLFSRKKIEHPIQETLTIYDENNQYTPDFKTLLSPYYLAF